MEKILQNLVRIIIIGSLCEKTSVMCNRQFLSAPPLPYYHNNDYFVRGFAPYQEAYPVYYPEENVPPPISFQNMNYFAPPQLFQQDENYHPPVPPTRESYPVPQIYPYKDSYYQQPSYASQPQGMVPQVNFNPPQPTLEPAKYTSAPMNYMNPSQQKQGSSKHQSPSSTFKNALQFMSEEEKNRLPPMPSQKTKVHSSNIIHKVESYQPYYHDEYNKNYHDEEYVDNYSDDSSYSDPCAPASSYQYIDENKPSQPNGKSTLCNPYFQPNFASNIHTLKTPITLLPSRFPPRVEELIERIQNYFSTYTQQGMQNQTGTSTTIKPSVEGSSESETPSTLMAEDSHKKNTTGENQASNLQEQELVEKTTVSSINDLEKTEVVTTQNVEIERKEISSATEADVQNKNELPVGAETTSNPTKSTPCSTEGIQQFQKIEEHTQQKEFSTTDASLQNETSTESNATEGQVTNSKGLSSSTESADIVSITEEYSSIPTTSVTFHQVTDNNG